jgi:hypothetical protein
MLKLNFYVRRNSWPLLYHEIMKQM